jgi:hypothetical protein
MAVAQSIKKPKMQKYELRGFIYQGRDIPSGDADAASGRDHKTTAQS